MGEAWEQTYAELDRSASKAAAGLTPGETLLVPARRDLEFVTLVHACARSGAVLAPLDPRLTDGEAAVLRDLAAGLEAAPGDTILFTSGTTASPKPVVLSPENHAASAIASAWNLGVAPDDRWLCVLPLHHVGGLAILLRSVMYGTTAVLHERFDAHGAVRAIEGGEVTVASLVPTMLRRMRAAGMSHGGALRAVLLGGGPVPRDLLEWAARIGLPALQTYGMTETASQIATLRVDEAIQHHGSAGRPLLGVELRVSDEGEVLVRGPMVARSAGGEGGWLHTGDAGHLDENGFLHVHGRIDETIVTGGENVAAAEVEDVLVAHPAVADVAVAGQPDPEWGELVAAWVVLATHATDAELTAHCRSRLAGFKVPKRFVRVGELPRNEAGKVVRARLPRASGG